MSQLLIFECWMLYRVQRCVSARPFHLSSRRFPPVSILNLGACQCPQEAECRSMNRHPAFACPSRRQQHDWGLPDEDDSNETSVKSRGSSYASAQARKRCTDKIFQSDFFRRAMRRATVQSFDFPTTSSNAKSWSEMQTISFHIPRRLDPPQ
jgi:hypothetical protein